MAAAGFLLFVLGSMMAPGARAQAFSSSFHASALPNAPNPSQNDGHSADNAAERVGTASISGTVLDTYGDVVQGVTLTLTGTPGFPGRSAKSGDNGQFAFSGLAAGVYRITATAPGMSRTASPKITLQKGTVDLLPPIHLGVSGGVITVTVSGSSRKLSREQVQIAVHQRVAGVIPNFYTSYDWNAPPILARQKFQLSFRSIFDPVELAGVASIAGAEQYENVFPAYGGGIGGYGKRFGAQLANHVSSDLLSEAVFPSLLHQDPRYFYKADGSVGSRVFYAISAVAIARADNGRWEPNYSAILGNFSGAALSNRYYPVSDRGGSLILFNGLADMGGDAVTNLIRQFVFNRLRKHVPTGANSHP